MSTLAIEDGADFHLRWKLIGPPQRPLPAVAEIAEIDVYPGLVSVPAYRPRSVIRAHMEEEGFAVRFAETSGYPLAELCPLLILERA